MSHPVTGYNVSTDIPSGIQGERYMSAIASTLGYHKNISIATYQSVVEYVTSPNPNGLYTQGDIVLVYVVFTLPVKAYGSIYLLIDSEDS